jgi:hypothetical protein
MVLKLMESFEDMKARRTAEMPPPLDGEVAMDNVSRLANLPRRFAAPLKSPKWSKELDSALSWNPADKCFLYVHGRPGTGKSFAAAYVLFEWEVKRLEKYCSAGGFTACPATWVSAYQATSEDEYYKEARRAVFLVIDDLGAEDPSAWTRAKLAEIISARYNDAKPTVITSNIAPLKLAEIYSHRMADRIIGESKIITFMGESYRLAENKG